MITSRTKHLLFSAVPVVLLVLALACAEVMLRFFGVATPPPLVTEVQYDGVHWYQTNRGFAAKYFSPGTPVIPEFKPTLFRRQKPAGTLRIMCLGSSSMFGTPYDMNANIPGIVRKQLRHLYPAVEFEVINWGASAINSNVIRDFAPRLLQYAPDLVLIYMGHNEYYGPDGVGASFLEKFLPALTRLKYAAREWRLVRVVMGLLAGMQRSGAPAANLMREVSGGQLVRSGTADEQRVFANFENNLQSILRTFRGADVPVIVCEPSSNLMFPPFVADSLKSALPLASFASEMQRDGMTFRYPAMLDGVRRLNPADSGNAAVTYWKGVALRGLGRSVEARACLVAARDSDLLKFRAPGEISAITRRVCAREGVSVFSGDSILSSWSADGIAGDTLFWEHLHPTALGYYRLANAFVDEIVRGGIIPPATTASDLLPFNNDSLSLCWLEHAYGEYSIRHLTGHWPFEHYSRATPVLDGADGVLAKMVADVHARKIPWNEACYTMATYFWRIGRTRDALTMYEAMLEEYPSGFYANYLKGSLLNTLGRTDEAVRYYRQSIASNPEYSRARLDLGLILVNGGAYDLALRELTIVIRQSGNEAGDRQIKATAHYGIAALCANRGDREGALKELAAALALVPVYADALRMREALTGQGR